MSRINTEYENIDDYIEAHIDEEPRLLNELNRYANLHLLNGRMCSGHTQGRVLKMLVEMINPGKAFEMGTFAGYSALSIAEALAPDAELITVEADDELEGEIKHWLEKSEHKKKITLIIGDALKIAEQQADNSFDLIFIDADKRSYCDYYLQAKRIVKPGGYIIADNTLWDGHVLEANPSSAQTVGIQKFNDMVKADGDASCIILPLRDGLSVIRINKPEVG